MSLLSSSIYLMPGILSRNKSLFVLIALALGTQVMAAQGKGVPVSVAPVQEQPIYQTVQLTGTVTSPRVATLSTSTSGLVSKIHADEGVSVKADDILLTLDSKLAELQWQSAMAKTEQAKNALQDAKRRLNEARMLTPQRSIAETLLRNLEAEVLEDQSVFEQMKADEKYQQEILQRNVLKAPFDGVVSKKLTELGEWVEPGDGVFEVVATDDLRLDFSVSEDYLAQVDADTRVTFMLNAYPEKAYSGRIGTVVPVLDPGARTFLLRVLVDKADSRIIPGMSVNATLQVPTGRNGLVIPKDAMLRYPDGRIIVWTVEEGEAGLVAAERVVQTGVSFDSFIEIRKGLAINARVVVQGNESLRNGQQVFLTTSAQRNGS